MLQGWIGQVISFLTAEFANVFPNLAGIFGSIISGLLKPQAAALHKAMLFFTEQLKTGDWETAVTATLNYIGTEEMQILSDVEKHLLQAFMHKAKP